MDKFTLARLMGHSSPRVAERHYIHITEPHVMTGFERFLNYHASRLVDAVPVPATVYIGNPRQSEAEAIALVHVPNVGDYLVDFSEETFRQASKPEFITLYYGAWTWKPMTHGRFGPALAVP